MSWNVCSISNQPLVIPVVSKKTGHIFQRSTIIKYIETFHKCPITQIPLQLSDLIQCKKTTHFNVASNCGSIIKTLDLLKNQFDILVLQAFNLKNQLQQQKQRLSQALYEFDASTRVIGKLTKQIEELKMQIDFNRKLIDKIKIMNRKIVQNQ